MEPFLETERRRCEKISSELDLAKKDLERFWTEWEPAYSRWFHGMFGEKLTRLRELEATASALGRIVTSVKTEAIISRCTPREAYERFQRMQAGAEKIDEMRSRRQDRDSTSGNKADDDSHEKSSNGNDELPPEVEEFLKKGFEKMFGHVRFSQEERGRMFASFKESFREDVLGQKRSSKHEDEEENERRRGSHHSRRNSSSKREMSHRKETSEDLRRKQIYRDLARKLHPDTNADLTSREKDLWHEVQAAYESRNLGLLETLAAMIESEGGAGYSKIGNISQLRSIFRELQKKLKTAQKALRQAKKELSWKFSETEKQPGKLREISGAIEFGLKMDIRELEAEVNAYERQITRWKTPMTLRKRREPVSREKPQQRTIRPPGKKFPGMTKAEMDAYTGFGNSDRSDD